jgi:hypothetical protein
MSSMDTLKAAQDPEKAGFPKLQAEAISRIVNDLGRADLVTKDYLDRRLDAVSARFETLLWKHTVAIIATMIAVGGFLLRLNH